MKATKQIMAFLLSFAILFTMIPADAISVFAASEVTSDNFTFTSIDGDSVHIKPYQSEVTVLIFGACFSTYTEDLLKLIANSDWVNCSEIRTIYVECSNEYCSSKTAVLDFANNIGNSDIIYCYDSSSGRMESYNALAHYLTNASGSGIEVMVPIVVLLDEYNHIMDVSQDVISARNIINKISSFTNVNYTKSTANVNILGQENYDYAYEVLEQLNKLRNAQNLNALTMDEKLLDAAMHRAAEISTYFSHTRPNGEDCLTILEYLAGATRGENIAMKQTTPNAAMDSWINSPRHYANMIHSEYQSVGIGCFKAPDGHLCWVQLFSSTSSDSITKTGSRSVTKTVEISKSKMSLEANLSKESIIANGTDTSQLNVYLYHSDAQDGEFSKLDPSSFNYSSTNTSVASINTNGIITSKISGRATVTAALKDDSNISISKTITSTGGITASLKYGSDRFSFGKDIAGYVGEEIETLVVYTTANENIASLDISSSNSSVVEIGTIKIGSGEYITGENEYIATIPLKLKKKGSATITIVSPENVSTSITVSVEQVTYAIKMYSEIPTLVVGEGRSIGAALQLERNGTLVEDTCKYSFVSSNTDVMTVSNVRNETDGVYFYINGHKSGVAKLTVTETNTGALYSTLVQVNDGIITYNAEALPTYYDRDAECNGFVNGMYMDEFSSKQKNDTTLSVSFNVYNTTSLVGVVDVYDKNNRLVNTYPIKRYDGGIVSSLYETIKEGYYLIKDVVTGDILTYKQSSYSQKTEIKNIDVPIGGRIEITNDINYSDSCCILNVTELSITTILTVGDTIKGLSSSEIKKIAEESSVTILKNEIGSKLPEIASEFRKKIIKSIAEDAGDVIVADALNIASDNALNIFESFDIDFTKLVVDSAASLGVGIAEDAFVAATAFIGATLKGMFIVADYLELSCFIMQIAIPRSDKAMKIYFDDENGCLVSNGVSIKAQDGTTDLSASNFVMHAIVLSNEEDLTNEVKNSLDDISNDYVVRDIYLERDGVVSQPGQTVQVYMPIPDNYDPNKCKLYWVKDDGTLEQKDFTIVGNSIMFTTDHFSYWALVNESSLSAISVYSNPTKTTYYIGDSLNTSGLKLLATYSDGSTETVTSGFGVSGFSSTTAGTKTVTVSYEGFTDTFTVTVKTPSIVLSSSSKNMSVGDLSTITAATTPSGQTITWTSSNTSVATVSNGTITAKDSGSATITAKFTYNGITYSSTCSIVVNEVAVLESISIISNPSKTTYYIGDALNTDGLKLLATYSDGLTETIISSFATSGFSSTSAGTKTVTVSYQGYTDTFTITVITPYLTISENNVSLKVGNTVKLSAISTPSDEEVDWTSSDMSIATVSNGVITAKKAGTTTITAKFTYNGIEYSDVCTVTCIVPVGLEIDKLPNKTVFYVGDGFDRRGLKTKMLYSDGSYESGLGVTSTSLDQVSVFLSEGTRTVIVYNGSYSTSYTIEVKPLIANLLTNEQSLNIGNTHQIEFETSPGDMSQLVSAKWTSSNRNVATVDENGVVKAVGVGTAEITLKIVNGACSTTSNTCTITVDNPIESISINSSSARTDYYIGDLLDVSGLNLLVTYEDGSTETVTNGFTTSGFSSTSAGTKTVTVSYEGFTDTFTVTVKTPSITLSANSRYMTVGDSSTITATTTPSGQAVTWTSSNTSVATVSEGTITAKASGSTTITAKFTYNGTIYSSTCTITVVEPPLSGSLSIDSPDSITIDLQFKVAVCLNSEETQSLKFLLKYDSSKIQYVSHENSQFYNYNTNKETLGEIVVDGYTIGSSLKNGSKLFYITFKAIAIGDTEIDIDVLNATNTTNNRITLNGCSSQIEIVHKHNYVSNMTQKPNCTTAGIKTYTCSSCGDYYTESIPATGHTWKNASCEDPKTCTKCGATSGSALGHDYSARTTKNPSCTENGTKTYTCTECGDAYTKNIPALNHNYDFGKVTKAATCKATGLKTYTCSVCKGTKTETIAKLTTHTYSNNCDKSCNVCGKTRTVGAHKYSNNCDTTCNYCNAKRTIKHTYSNNCDTSCNVCKATRTITHSYKTTTTKATLTKNGSIVKKCTVCGKVASKNTIKYVKTFKLSTTTYTYDGKVKTPSVTVKDSAGKTLKKNTDYTVTYATGRKNVGKYKVTIKFKGNYKGTKTLYFKINPVKTTVKSLTAGKKSLKVAITKKTAQVTGYQIQYATNKSFKSAKSKYVTSYKTTSATLKGLTAKKTYYVRVRTYKTVKGVKYYSGWSTVKYKKTK